MLQCILQQSCVCKCLCSSKKNGFSLSAAVLLKVPSLLPCSNGNAAQMDERCFRLFFRRGSKILWRIVYLLRQNRMELFPSVRYHLSQFSLSNGLLIRVSIFALVRPSLGFSWALTQAPPAWTIMSPVVCGRKISTYLQLLSCHIPTTVYNTTTFLCHIKGFLITKKSHY